MTLTVGTANENVVNTQYAVRGEIVQIANQLKAEGRKITFCNIGNPQSLGQKPITFFRQVLALCDCPSLLDNADVDKLFPADAIARAKAVLAACPGGTGAYSMSKGIPICREAIARGIEARDGFPCDPNLVFITDGASPGVHMCMKVVLRNEEDAILTPIPQYPLYSATLTLYGGSLAPYYLDESKSWSLGLEELESSIKKARDNGKTVRAIVVINPGNPTGQVLSLENQKQIVEFCKKEKLILLADEVYQDNIYAEGKEFNSFKKVLRSMGPDYNDVQLISFMSTSKGFYGECGRRGGYMELVGFDDDVNSLINKIASVNLCSNTAGQILMSLVMDPPKAGDVSYDLYVKERDAILSSLKRRAKLIVDGLNKLEGVSCNDAEGAMYAFPTITLPPKAQQAAEAEGRKPDAFYCIELLKKTGIVVVPGSGFGQKEGTFHFRTTFLPSEETFPEIVSGMTQFHEEFMKKYA
jgi:alanine transaminase